MRHGSERQRGFSLIELLILVIIMGILAAVAIPMYLDQRDKARDAAVKAGVHAVQVGIVTWAADHDEVHPTDGDVTSLRWIGAPSAFSAYVQPCLRIPSPVPRCATAGTPVTTRTTARSV